MNDAYTTITQLKTEVINMCRRKGWGKDGIQNPQHVAMAMMVETMEMLELFGEISGDMAEDLISGMADGLKYEIAEEMSDVMMYSLQLMYTTKVDVASLIGNDLSDDTATVAQLMAMVEESGASLIQQAMQVCIKARFVLEVFQWLNDPQVEKIMEGEDISTCREVGSAFGEMFTEILRLAGMLGIDISGSIARKIAIVDKRVYPEDDPVR